MREQQFNKYGSVMCQEEIDEKEAEHARWFTRLRKQSPVFQNDALWDAITAKRLAQQDNEVTKARNDLYDNAALSSRDARYVI